MQKCQLPRPLKIHCMPPAPLTPVASYADLHVTNIDDADAEIRGGYPVAVGEELQTILGLSDADTADVIGRSRRTYTRYRNQSKQLGLPESERVFRYVRLLRGAAEILGSEEKAAWWMTVQYRLRRPQALRCGPHRAGCGSRRRPSGRARPRVSDVAGMLQEPVGVKGTARQLCGRSSRHGHVGETRRRAARRSHGRDGLREGRTRRCVRYGSARRPASQ